MESSFGDLGAGFEGNRRSGFDVNMVFGGGWIRVELQVCGFGFEGLVGGLRTSPSLGCSEFMVGATMVRGRSVFDLVLGIDLSKWVVSDRGCGGFELYRGTNSG